MNPNTWGRGFLALVFLLPMVVTVLVGSFLSATVGKGRFFEAFLIPVTYVSHWASGGYTGILVIVGLVVLVGAIGIAVKNRWIVVASTSALSALLGYMILISNLFGGGYGG